MLPYAYGTSDERRDRGLPYLDFIKGDGLCAVSGDAGAGGRLAVQHPALVSLVVDRRVGDGAAVQARHVLGKDGVDFSSEFLTRHCSAGAAITAFSFRTLINGTRVVCFYYSASESAGTKTTS